MCIATKVILILRLLHCRAVHFITLSPVETIQAHQKHIVKSLAKTSKRQGDRSFEYTPQYACGGPGGICIPVQNSFQSTSYNHKKTYYLVLIYNVGFPPTIVVVCLLMAESRGVEPHPG